MITTGNPRFEKNLHSSGKIPGKIRSLRHFPPADPVRGRLCAAPVRVRISRWRALPRMPPENTASPNAPPAQNRQACGTGFPGNVLNRTEFRALRLSSPRGYPDRTEPRALRLSSHRGCLNHIEPRALRLSSPRGCLNRTAPGRASAPAGPSPCSNPPGFR